MLARPLLSQITLRMVCIFETPGRGFVSFVSKRWPWCPCGRTASSLAEIENLRRHFGHELGTEGIELCFEGHGCLSLRGSALDLGDAAVDKELNAVNVTGFISWQLANETHQAIEGYS